MKTTQTKLVVLFGSILAVFLTAAPARAAAAAAAGGAGASAGIGRPNLPSAAAGGMSSAGAGIGRDPFASANTAADAAFPRGSVDRARPDPDDVEAPRSRKSANAPAGLNANATAHASEEGKTHGLAIAAAASGGLSMSLAPDDTMKEIRGARFTDRTKLSADIEAHLAASEKLVAELETDSKSADSRSRAALAKSLVAVRKQQQEVRAGLKASAKASDENWGKIQSQLAKSYGDLAHVVSDAEVAAKASATATAAAKP